MLPNKDNPNACKNDILVNPNIKGINQFHNNITGKPIINTAVSNTPIANKNLNTFSIVFFI